MKVIESSIKIGSESSQTHYKSQFIPGCEENNFVAWIDIMGAGNILRKSLSGLGEAVASLNNICLGVCMKYKYKVDLHSLNDGVFGISSDRENIKLFCKKVFSILSDQVVISKTPNEMIIFRGAVAFGNIIYVVTKPQCNYIEIVLGKPKKDAFEGEDKAPPFGIYIHQTAVNNGFEKNWKWFEPVQIDPLIKALNKYFDWVKMNRSYSLDRIEEHRSQMLSYFI